MADAEQPILRYPLSWRSWRFRLVAGLVVLLLFVRVAWGWEAGRRLRAELNQIHQGEPVVLADLHLEKVNDAENAWIAQTKAAAAIVSGIDSPRSSNDTYRDYPPYPSFWMKRAAKSENAQGQMFALLRQARGLSKVQVRAGFSSSAVVYGPQYNVIRHMANLAGDGGLYAHVTGDDWEAIERTRDIMHLAASLRHDPIIISQLVTAGIEAMALDNLQIIAPGLRFGSAATKRPATRQQIGQVISQLLDEEALWNGLRESIRSERVLDVDLIRVRAAGAKLIEPLAEMEELRLHRQFDLALAACDVRNMPAATSTLSRIRLERPNRVVTYTGKLSAERIPRYSRWYLESDINFLSGYFRTIYRVIAERRMTAVSLAAQLYRFDHGRWPERLEELVPEYLAAVPLDPFQTDGRTVGYRLIKGVLPGGGDRPVVFTETIDAVDQGPTNEANYSWHQAQRIAGSSRPWNVRQYRDLSRFEPLLAPSTQAVDGDPKKADAPGK